MPEYVEQNSVSPYPDLPKATQEYLREGAAIGSRDNNLFSAACQFRDAGYSQAQAEGPLIDRAVRDGLSEPYAKRKIASAYSQPAREPAKHTQQASPSAAPTPHTSNPPPSGSAPVLPLPIPDGFRVLLETCFEQQEGVAIGKGRIEAGDLKIDGGDILRRERWIAKGSPPTNKTGEGVFIRINPLKSGGKSDKDVIVFRHVLVEFDSDQNGHRIPKELQYRALIDSGFPLSAIVDSGNISLQALLRVEAGDRKEFNERWKVVADHFQKFDGFDSSTKNPSRYCRLPGVERNLYDPKGKLVGTGRQELLAVKVGPASWQDWENGQTEQLSEKELQEHDQEVTKRLLGEDRPFPAPMDDAAFCGIAGEIVKIIEPGNEPCQESLLGHLLVAMGNMIGWGPWMDQGGDQRLNEFGLFVGPSGIGRKGTAWHLIRRLLLEVDHDWTAKRVRRAIQTGEAIIHNIRDPGVKGSGRNAQIDPGITDKRLVMMETEQTRFLTVGKRHGNNLFDVAHDCWDSLDPLCSDSKTASEQATHPHVSMIGHTTREAYLSQLPEEEKTNGSVNRSLILVVTEPEKGRIQSGFFGGVIRPTSLGGCVRFCKLSRSLENCIGVRRHFKNGKLSITISTRRLAAE
jgi:hypothetical protein